MIALAPTLRSVRCLGAIPKSAPRGFSSSCAHSLKLAYDLHEPSKSQPGKLGNPIVFIHGLFGNKKNNRSMSKVLARNLYRPVYAIDLRNHGDSPHDPHHDYIALAEDVEGFIAEHSLKQPTLLGHSMGAKTAMVVALRNPSLIEKLVSIDNAPVDAALKSDFGKYIQGMRKVEDSKVNKQSDADAILQEYEKSLPIRQFLLTNLHRAAPNAPLTFRIPIRTLGASLTAMADFPFKDPDVARYNKPTLFVRGTRSHYVADEMLPLIGRFFPKFEVADVEGGHWIVSERPEEFRVVVERFLRGGEEGDECDEEGS